MRKLFLLILCTLLISCGTINTKSEHVFKREVYSGPYSGTIYDLKRSFGAPYFAIKQNDATRLGEMFMIMDVPFSIIGDTFCIPFVDLPKMYKD